MCLSLQAELHAYMLYTLTVRVTLCLIVAQDKPLYLDTLPSQ